MPEDEPTPEELLDIEAADAYLDALGNKRDFEGDQLGATQWRKDVDAEPLGMTPLPQELLGGPVPSRLPEGPTMSDSIADRARQLMVLADQAPAAQTEQLQQAVTEWNASAQALLGEGGSGAMLLNQVCQQVTQTCGELLQAIEVMKQTARDTGQGHLGG